MKLFGFLAVFSSAKEVEFDFTFDTSRTGTNNVNQNVMFYAQMAGIDFIQFSNKEWQLQDHLFLIQNLY